MKGVTVKGAICLMLATLFFTLSCRHNSGGESVTKSPAQAGKAAQIHFENAVIRVGDVALTVEMAKTPSQHARGLMFRQQLDENSGMLFVFQEERKRSFWMKNTFVPLSIGFFDKNKKLIEWLDMKPAESEMQTDLPMYHSRAPAKYALEVNQGWFKRNKIKPGAQLTIVE